MYWGCIDRSVTKDKQNIIQTINQKWYVNGIHLNKSNNRLIALCKCMRYQKALIIFNFMFSQNKDEPLNDARYYYWRTINLFDTKTNFKYIPYCYECIRYCLRENSIYFPNQIKTVWKHRWSHTKENWMIFILKIQFTLLLNVNNIFSKCLKCT